MAPTYQFPDSPRMIDDAGSVAWDSEADVVIVGFGGAGAAAAVQALECGASVLALDRFGGGGATHYSGGVIYAGGTRYLRDAGYQDTPDEMYKYLEAEGATRAVTPETLRRFCDGSSGDLEWLAGFGIPYGGKAFEEKTSFPPDDYFLYYSGNEKIPAYAAKAKPAPRGHRVAINGFGGRVHFAKLKEAALGKGLKLRLHAPVMRLLMNAEREVIGVETNELPDTLAEQHQQFYKIVHPWRPFNHGRAMKAIAGARAMEAGIDRRKLIRARKGVILATGGFNSNFEMTQQYSPALAVHFGKLLRLGSIGDDGSGIRLGETAGGATRLMEYISVARTLVPPNVFVHGIVVNQRGERFINEAAYAMRIGETLLGQPQGVAWLILESRDFWKGLWKSFFPGGNFLLWGAPALLNIFFGGTRRGSTLAKLARKIGVDAEGLMRTATQFNKTINEAGVDQFGKAKDHLRTIEKGAFYAVNLSLGNSFAPAQSITMGGLVVDGESGLVKREDGSPIKGLYAAGRAAVGFCSQGFVSGVTIADTVFSGRRAGRAAAGQSGPQANPARRVKTALSGPVRARYLLQFGNRAAR